MSDPGWGKQRRAGVIAFWTFALAAAVLAAPPWVLPLLWIFAAALILVVVVALAVGLV